MKLIPRNDYYLDDFFNNFFEREDEDMKCDIYLKDNNYHVEMDVPGFKKEDIKIECNKGNLIITAEKNENHEENTAVSACSSHDAVDGYRSLRY